MLEFLDQFARPDVIVLLLFTGALFTYIVGKVSVKLAKVSAVALSGFATLLVLIMKEVTISWSPSVAPVNIALVMQSNPFSWFFAIILAGVAVSGIYLAAFIRQGNDRDPAFFGLNLGLMGAMLGVVFSGDLLSFFILWEIMTLTSYLLTVIGGKRAKSAAMKYMIISTAGAYAILIGITLLYAQYGTVQFSALATLLTNAESGFLYLVLTLVGIGFAVKAAITPFYIWAPPAYSEAPDTFTPVFSGALSKLGPYGFALFFYGIVGLPVLVSMGTLRGVSIPGYTIALLGSITSVIATLYAVAQDDIKKLLAYSSVSQLGYVVMGIGIGTTLGVAGGLYHALNHALFKTVLFMGAAIIIQRAGTRKMSDMGGLATKMPLTFITMLIAIFALAGIPLTSGFGSKWLLYEAAIEKRFVLMAPLAFVASVGSFLYSFRILQSVFLGQTPENLKDARDPPIYVMLPMLVITAIIVFFAIVPSIPMGAIAAAEGYLGIDPINYSTYGFVGTTDFGAYNAAIVMFAIFGAMILAFSLFMIGKKAKKVGPTDTFLAGEVFEHHEDLYLHYAVNFYRPLERIFEPYLRKRLEAIYSLLWGSWELISEGIRRVYTGDVQHYVYYTIGFLGLVLLAGWLL